MEGGSFTLRWDDDPRVQSGGVITEEVICDMETVQNQFVPMEGHSSHLGGDSMIADTDQIAAENLIFLAQDVVGQLGYSHMQHEEYTDHPDLEPGAEVECQVTEEVITDDWVQPNGQERVDVPLDQLAMAAIELNNEENNIDVPLPTDQDEYTAQRPYPCDFCSRRFRKKANLMNHMVAHQNDRPFGCNLCGARYVRRCDLLNHLKVHAFVPEDGEEGPADYEMAIMMVNNLPPTTKRKGRRRSRQSSENGSFSYSLEAETSVAARTQMYGGQGAGQGSGGATGGAGSSGNGGGGMVAALPSVAARFQVTDPRRPFVCQHCGVGFAREKALASHARIHGGDSPLECNMCGELCWSREQLAAHARSKHPHRPIHHVSPTYNDASSDNSFAEERIERDIGSPELTCKDCGAGFQRADLLRRHIRAAHSYKLEPPEMHSDDGADLNEAVQEAWETLEHTCSACGEGFRDALDLLAHAESHARSRHNRCMQCGEKFSDEQAVADHVAAVHSPLSPSTCSRCGRSCRDRRALLKHAQAQHSAPPHTLFCSKCGKSFHNKARLKRHMASHRDKAVACNVCGERFTDGRSLMNHRHSHSGTATRQFPCKECGKTFGSRSSQQIHIRIHTGERPYACRFCWKAFADGGTLRKHERIHTGEKPYACAVCPRAFNQRVVLREHVRSHHSAPDARRGTATSPFWCAVCGRLFHTSADLVQHLIQHCDANTAMKRQPQVGPRKYKRRRKLKPHELEALSNHSERNDSDHSIPEPEEPEILFTPVKRRPSQSKKPKKAKVESPPVEDGYDSTVLNLFNNTSNQRIAESLVSGSARTKGKTKGKRGEAATRPKMIHTQKARATDGETPTGRKRGRQPATTSVTTHTTAAKEERIRPRTKNVKYHESGRPPTATFPASVKAEPDTDIAADLREILRAPTPSRPKAVAIVRRERIKREPITSDGEVNEHTNGITVKAELDEQTVDEGPFRCEMCSQAFPLREQLLLHVPIHI